MLCFSLQTFTSSWIRSGTLKWIINPWMTNAIGLSKSIPDAIDSELFIKTCRIFSSSLEKIHTFMSLFNAFLTWNSNPLHDRVRWIVWMALWTHKHLWKTYNLNNWMQLYVGLFHSIPMNSSWVNQVKSEKLKNVEISFYVVSFAIHVNWR